MKKYLLGTAALVATMIAHSADAASAPGDYSWTGPYIGGQFGGEFGSQHRDFSDGTSTGSFSNEGVVGGATAGYNQQLGSVVIGLESDISASSVTGATTCPSTNYSCKVNNTWFATLRPRIGYSIEDVLPYITGGLAVGDVHSHSSTYATGATGTDFSDTQFGWTLGGGLELPFDDHWSAKIEYLFIRFSDANGVAAHGDDITGTSKVAMDNSIVRAGINYKF